MEKFQVALFSVELPAALLVTVVFWTILAPDMVAAARYGPNCTAAEAMKENVSEVNCTEIRDAERLAGTEAMLVSTDNLSQHAANSVIMLLELLLNKLRLRPLNGVLVGLWALAYCAFAIFVWYPLVHFWVYPFMDSATMQVIPWQLGLLVGHWVIYALCLCASETKFRIIPREGNKPATVAARGDDAAAEHLLIN
jgi:hypothetical protein